MWQSNTTHPNSVSFHWRLRGLTGECLFTHKNMYLFSDWLPVYSQTNRYTKWLNIIGLSSYFTHYIRMFLYTYDEHFINYFKCIYKHILSSMNENYYRGELLLKYLHRWLLFESSIKEINVLIKQNDSGFLTVVFFICNRTYLFHFRIFIFQYLLSICYVNKKIQCF